MHFVGFEVRDLAVDHLHVAMRAAREFRIVRDHDDGGAHLVDAFEQVHDLARHQRIEVARGLVREDQLGIAGNRARDRHALLLAARQLRRHVLHARRQADDLQCIGDALVAFRGLHAAIAQRHVHVVVDVEVGHEIEALEDEADLLIAQRGTRIVGKICHFHVVELVAAGLVGLEQSRNIEERGLARTRGPGDREEFTGLHLQREIAQCMRLDEIGAKYFADVLHGEHGENSS